MIDSTEPFVMHLTEAVLERVCDCLCQGWTTLVRFEADWKLIGNAARKSRALLP